jgi:hypothetical protein
MICKVRKGGQSNNTAKLLIEVECNILSFCSDYKLSFCIKIIKNESGSRSNSKPKQTKFQKKTQLRLLVLLSDSGHQREIKNNSCCFTWRRKI